MTRVIPLLAAAAMLMAGVPAAAQPTALRAEFATPFSAHTEIIIDGRMWSCVGNACSSPSNDPRPGVACRKLARKLGPVTRFSTPRGELDAAGLASCNQDRS
jgi:hypothetical protein